MATHSLIFTHSNFQQNFNMEQNNSLRTRPFTYGEFFDMLMEQAKSQNAPCINDLDYADVNFLLRGRDFTFADAEIRSVTSFGGSEGIYTDFFLLCNDGRRLEFATAKTLLEDDETFVAMHTFAGMVTLIGNRYIRQHIQDFVWTDYSYGFIEEDGSLTCYCYKGTLEDYKQFLQLCKEQGKKPYLMENTTKKVIQ